MGMFDSYWISWGQGEEEIQTKEFDSSLRSWRLGQKVDLSELEEGFGSGEERWFVEDFCIGDCWGWDKAQRWAALVHCAGMFADAGCGTDQDEALMLGRALEEKWADPVWRAAGLEKLLSRHSELSQRACEDAARMERLCSEWIKWSRMSPKEREEQAKSAFGLWTRTDFDKQTLEEAMAKAMERSQRQKLAAFPDWGRALARARPPAAAGGKRSGAMGQKNPAGEACLARIESLAKSCKWELAAQAAQSNAHALQQLPEESFCAALGHCNAAFWSHLMAPEAFGLCAALGRWPREVELPDGSKKNFAQWAAANLGAPPEALGMLLDAGLADPAELAWCAFGKGSQGLREKLALAAQGGAGMERLARAALEAGARSFDMGLQEMAREAGLMADAGMLADLGRAAARRWNPSIGGESAPLSALLFWIREGADVSGLDADCYLPPVLRAISEREKAELGSQAAPSGGAGRKSKL